MTTNKQYPCGLITNVIIGAYYDTLNSLGSIRGTPVSAFRRKLAVALKKKALRVEMGAGGYPVGLMLNHGAEDPKPQRLTPPRKYYQGPWKCS